MVPSVLELKLAPNKNHVTFSAGPGIVPDALSEGKGKRRESRGMTPVRLRLSYGGSAEAVSAVTPAKAGRQMPEVGYILDFLSC